MKNYKFGECLQTRAVNNNTVDGAFIMHRITLKTKKYDKNIDRKENNIEIIPKDANNINIDGIEFILNSNKDRLRELMQGYAMRCLPRQQLDNFEFSLELIK